MMKTIPALIFLIFFLSQSFAQQGGYLGFQNVYSEITDINSSYCENIYLMNYTGTPLKAVQLKVEILSYNSYVNINSIKLSDDLNQANYLFDYEVNSRVIIDDNYSKLTISILLLGNFNVNIPPGKDYCLFSINFNISAASDDSLHVAVKLIDVVGATDIPITDANLSILNEHKINFNRNLNAEITPTLFQNYPNPFNPNTKICYVVPIDEKRKTQDVNLIVYDILGNEVITLANGLKEAGYYEVDFNASQLASGIYIYRLQAGSFIATKKMIVLK